MLHLHCASSRQLTTCYRKTLYEFAINAYTNWFSLLEINISVNMKSVNYSTIVQYEIRKLIIIALGFALCYIIVPYLYVV